MKTVLLTEELPLTDDPILLNMYKKTNDYRQSDLLLTHVNSLPDERLRNKFKIQELSVPIDSVWIVSDENGCEHIEYCR